MFFCDNTFYLDKNQQFDVHFIHLTYVKYAYSDMAPIIF